MVVKRKKQSQLVRSHLLRDKLQENVTCIGLQGQQLSLAAGLKNTLLYVHYCNTTLYWHNYWLYGFRGISKGDITRKKLLTCVLKSRSIIYMEVFVV